MAALNKFFALIFVLGLCAPAQLAAIHHHALAKVNPPLATNLSSRSRPGKRELLSNRYGSASIESPFVRGHRPAAMAQDNAVRSERKRRQHLLT